MPQRELTPEEMQALKRNTEAGLQRSRLENGEVKSDTMQGKLADELRSRGIRMLEDKGFPLTEANLAIMEDWVKNQIATVTEKRRQIRERNMQILKDFGPGGKWEGRKLDPRALFKGDEFEEVAMEPGGITDTMAMKSSIPTALAYLAFLQKEGHETFAGIQYDSVIY